MVSSVDLKSGLTSWTSGSPSNLPMPAFHHMHGIEAQTYLTATGVSPGMGQEQEAVYIMPDRLDLEVVYVAPAKSPFLKSGEEVWWGVCLKLFKLPIIISVFSPVTDSVGVCYGTHPCSEFSEFSCPHYLRSFLEVYNYRMRLAQTWVTYESLQIMQSLIFNSRIK